MPYFGVPIRNGVPIGLGSIAGFGISPFDPSQLFAGGEQGAWYDPSDLTTMFQDAAGTTPLTAVEQPVGLVLDKSRGLVLGSELVTNGDFSGGSTGWSVSAQSSISGGQARIVSSDGTFQNIAQSKTLSGPAWYELSVDIVSVTSGSLSFAFTGAGINASLGGVAGTKKYRFYISANTSSSLSFARTAGVTDITIDNISVRELPGNHATQSTSASRPVLSARVNLFLNSATLSTQNVTTVATNYTLRFEGAGSVTLSGTGSGTYNAGTHTVTCTAGTLTVTVTGSVSNADIRVANIGVSLPAYQAITTATSYNTTGFPMYLRFDGTDDSLATGTIDPGAVDKAQVFAGVRKLATSTGIVVELSSNADTQTGVFNVASDALTTSQWFTKVVASISGGGCQSVASPYASPVSSVVTSLMNIGGSTLADKITLRVDGVASSSRTQVTLGTGNFGSFPLYIGRRNNATLPFNGHLYSLILRFSATNLDAATITATETWVNGKTLAY